jgi:hypothetical protein
VPHVISIHEYVLKPGVDEVAFEHALRKAEGDGLLELPGLVGHHFVKGLRGVRRGHYAAIWVYSSREAWEALWGAVDRPRSPEEYPENWKVWENQVLDQFLDRDSDRIHYTAYEEI